MTETIFEATRRVGVRALVSAGWGGLGGNAIPGHVFILGNVPHDWLFDADRVQAVVHHGGAGTTAIGLAKGQPTCVVPFFGDQAFWGSMIHQAGAGPMPIPQRELCADSLTNALVMLLSEPAKVAAKHIAQQIKNEDGVSRGVQSFYSHLPLLNMRCDLVPTRVAIWFSVEHCLKLSAFAAQVLVEAQILELGSLDLHRPKEYEIKSNVEDPLLGGSVALFWMLTHHTSEFIDLLQSPAHNLIKMTATIPKGVIDILSVVSDGVACAPKLYGSTVREPGRRTDWKSGFKESGKSIFYGYYDGITGLYKTPIDGARREGVTGALKGMAKSWADVAIKPTAGIVSGLVYPLEGSWHGAAAKFRKPQDIRQRETRIAQGLDDIRNSTPEERAEVLSSFRTARQYTAMRQQQYAKMAQIALAQSSERRQENLTDVSPGSSRVSLGSGSMKGGAGP